MGQALDIRSEKLYDLAPDILDVMGLRALRPSAAVAKVMSVRDSRCIRVVIPDDHVECGYHEILLHDMGEEELPFMTRYQQDLERRRKACKERGVCVPRNIASRYGRRGVYDEISA